MHILPLLFSLLQLAYHLGKSCTQEIPTGRYSLTSRDIPWDSKRRREEPIRLKPPPEDWPSPTLGAADFVYDQPEVTSISPLQAYQHQLQEEYLKDLEENPQKNPINNQPTKDESVWSTSDEELRKLLDPNELLKLNKKLAPLLNTPNKIANSLKNKLNGPKPTSVLDTVQSITSGNRITTRATNVRGFGDEFSDRLKKSSEHKKRRVKKRLKRIRTTDGKTGEKIRSVKRKAKGRKFSFDVHQSDSRSKSSSEDDVSKPKKVSTTTTRKESSSSSDSSDSSTEVVSSTVHHAQSTATPEAVTTTAPTRVSSTEKVTSTTLPTTKRSTIAMTKTSSERSPTAGKEDGSSRKLEMREKRKRIRTEMEDILKEEQLEGSFDDRDSDWTTSEPLNFPIHNVTPRQALYVILKNKIVQFLDDIIKSPDS